MTSKPENWWWGSITNEDDDIVAYRIVRKAPATPETDELEVPIILKPAGWKFDIGDRVTKISGSSWTGHVRGFYATSLTPEGYAVESENERGSVQIYPVGALRKETRHE